MQRPASLAFFLPESGGGNPQALGFGFAWSRLLGTWEAATNHPAAGKDTNREMTLSEPTHF